MNRRDEIRNRVYTEQGIKVLAMLLVVLAVIGLEFIRIVGGIDMEYSVLFVAIVTGVVTYFFTNKDGQSIEVPKQTGEDIDIEALQEELNNLTN